MRRDYILTFITEMAVLASGVLVYKLAAHYLMQDGFSEYALSRRAVAFIQPAVLMGLGIALPRYIAIASAKKDTSYSSDLFFEAATIIIVSAIVIVSVLFFFFGNILAKFFYGESSYTHYLLPVGLMIAGLLLHTLCYSYYRGHLRMYKANVMQVLNGGLVPLVAFIWCQGSTYRVIFIMGIASIAISMLFWIEIAKKSSLKLQGLKEELVLLLSYGMRRVPGDFGIAALMSLPAFMITSQVGIREGGYVAFGVSLIRLAAGVFSPIGLILLPKASKLIVGGEFTKLRKHTWKILWSALLLTTTGVIIFELFARSVIDLYLGKAYEGMIDIARIMVPGAVAFSLYVSMRSIIDAYCVKAINTINIIVSLALYVAITFVIILAGWKNVYVLALMLPVGLGCLAILTMIQILRILSKKEDKRKYCFENLAASESS